MIHGHGDEYTGELLANFSSNVWYGAENEALYNHLASLLPSTTCYPETNAVSLLEVIASKIDIKQNEIAVCNGAIEAFYLIAHAFAGSVSLIVAPTFSEYADACRLHNHRVYLSPREELVHTIETIKPHIIWICNPNNPDGYCYPALTIRELIKSYPQSVFVIDQAYKEFCLNETIPANEINAYPNLILVQSLTKRYSIPGLRLGYLISNEDIVTKINRFRIPWSVNTLAIGAGKYILETDTTSFKLEVWLEETKLLQHNINALNTLIAHPSATPYFLIKMLRGNAKELTIFLLKDKVLVRDATNFEGLEGEYIRIISLSADKNKLLLDKLAEWDRSITA
jgi:threonine-phosphate decarboxylase